MTNTLTALRCGRDLGGLRSPRLPLRRSAVWLRIGGVDYPIAPAGYVYYPYGEDPLPGADCYCSPSMPAYDARGKMVG